MENKDSQWLIDIIESLKSAGEIYNETDFCKKTRIRKSFISDMKAGRAVITEQTVRKIKQAFPNSFGLSTAHENENSCPLCEEKDKRIAFMEKYISRLEDENAQLRKQLGMDEVKKVG